MNFFKKSKKADDNHGLKAVKYRRDITSEKKYKFQYSSRFHYKLLTITVYQMEHFVAEIKKNKSARYNSSEVKSIIIFQRDHYWVGRYQESSLTIYASLTLSESDCLEKQFRKYSKSLNTSSLSIGCFDKVGENEKRKEFLNLHNILKIKKIKDLGIFDCIDFDSLIYFKNSWSFLNILISGSNFIYVKNLPKFLKFNKLVTLNLRNIKFQNKSLEFKFFINFQYLENLTNFSIFERKNLTEQENKLCAFSGNLNPKTQININNMFLYGLFNSKKECYVILNRQIMKNRAMVKYFLQLLRKLDVKVYEINFQHLVPYQRSLLHYLNLGIRIDKSHLLRAE